MNNHKNAGRPKEKRILIKGQKLKVIEPNETWRHRKSGEQNVICLRAYKWVEFIVEPGAKLIFMDRNTKVSGKARGSSIQIEGGNDTYFCNYPELKFFTENID